MKDYEKLYNELLYAVSRKFPNESRHETALRYILETEDRVCNQAKELDTFVTANKTIENFRRKIETIKDTTK